MPLTCDCGVPEHGYEWLYYSPRGYSTMPGEGRRKRCRSCREMIPHGAIAAEYARVRYPADDIEERIHGEEVPLASHWVCERCADILFSLEDLGFCPSPEEDARELLKQYAVLYGPEQEIRDEQ